MYIELKCRSCGKAFHVDFTNNEYDVDKCPKCRSHLIIKMRLTAKRSQAQKHNVGTPCIHLQIKGDIPCLISGNGDISSECHDPEKQQKRSPQKAVSSAENRLSGSVFSNAFRLSRVIVSDHLPPQISLAGQRLTA